MKKYIAMISVVTLAVCVAVLWLDSSVITSGTHRAKGFRHIYQADKDLYKELKNIALDNKEIHLDTKRAIIIFGADDCVLCDKLKDSIYKTPPLSNKLKNDFALYYINTSYPKIHKIVALSPEIPSQLSTKALMQMYHIHSIPTIVFIAPNGREIFAYRGFMLAERFLATLEFFEDEQIQNLAYDDMLRKLLMMYEQKGV